LRAPKSSARAPLLFLRALSVFQWLERKALSLCAFDSRYRPLDDTDSEATRKWIEAENKLTFGRSSKRICS
jgi:hypothetical protein